MCIACLCDGEQRARGQDDTRLERLVTADASAVNAHGAEFPVDDSGNSIDFRDGVAADLAVGRRVQVQGSLTAGGMHVLAARIRFRD